MNIAPQRLFKLQGSDDLAGIGQQYSERSQFSGRQMEQSLAAKERSVRFEPEAGESEGGLFASANRLGIQVAGSGCRC
jgi:hypothetical protein